MTTASAPRRAYVAAGIPATQSIIYWRIGFSVGDQVVLVELPKDGGFESVLILRDIEMDRARQFARVDRVACPADFAPAGGLSGDRETANAQAAAAAAEAARDAALREAKQAIESQREKETESVSLRNDLAQTQNR